MSHLPGAVHQKRRLSIAEQGDGLLVGGRQGVGREITQIVQLFNIIQRRDPFPGHLVVLQIAVFVQRGNLQMVFHRPVVHNGKLKQIMRHLHQRTGNGDVAAAFDGLAVGKELLPRVIRPRHRNAAGFQHRLIDKKIFPIPGGRNGVMLSVRSLREHGLLHIGSVVGVNLPDVLNGDHPPGVDDGIGIGVGEEKQHVRLGAGLEIRQHLGLPALVGGSRTVSYFVAGGRFIGGYRRFKGAAAAVVAAVGGDDFQCDCLLCLGSCCLLRRRRRKSTAAQSQGQYQ